MLLTVSIFAVFLLGSIFAIAVGQFGNRFEIFFFGVAMLFLLGVWVLQGGISYDSGEVISVVGADTIVTDTYSTTTDLWTNAFGLLLVLVAAGLLLSFEVDRRKEKDKKLRSIDFDDE